MKIGIYTPYLDTMTGGERYMMTMASCLAQYHDVSIFWDDKTIIQKAKERFDLDLDTIKCTKNIFTPTTSFIERFKKSQQYDAIFVLSDGSIPLLASKHTFLHFQFPVEWVQAKKMIQKFKMARIQLVICNSQFTKSYIDRTFSIKSKIIYPPVHFTNLSASQNKENIILSIGRFGRLPNGKDFKKHAFLLDVFKQMVDSGIKDWTLVIAGNVLQTDQAIVDDLKKQASGYPVQIKSNISPKELQKIYAVSSIYWHAAGYGEDLQKHPELAEHFGITTVEAMANGLVPVVIKAGGQKEIIQNGENGFLWDTKEELLSQTKQLMHDPQLRKKMMSERKLLEEKFGEPRFCREIYELIKK
jgi:glycosyltransferase involved in cell wall biosynthesis